MKAMWQAIAISFQLLSRCANIQSDAFCFRKRKPVRLVLTEFYVEQWTLCCFMMRTLRIRLQSVIIFWHQ